MIEWLTYEEIDENNNVFEPNVIFGLGNRIFEKAYVYEFTEQLRLKVKPNFELLN